MDQNLWKYEATTGFTLQAYPEFVKPITAAGEVGIWGIADSSIVLFDNRGQILKQSPAPIEMNPGVITQELIGDQSGVWLDRKL